MHKKCFKTAKGGYTIIETMISLSIFLVIIISGTGALLNVNRLHQKSQDMRSIMDNLSFIMEDISRNLRTGSNYRCMGSFSVTQIDEPLSCASGGAIAFEYTFGNKLSSADQGVYKIESIDGGVTYNLSRSVSSGSAGSWFQLNPPEVVLSSVSGFSVLGAEAPPSDSQQPLVIIKLVGTITYHGVVSPFSIQTSVSQRLVDLE